MSEYAELVERLNRSVSIWGAGSQSMEKDAAAAILALEAQVKELQEEVDRYQQIAIDRGWSLIDANNEKLAALATQEPK